MSTRDNTKLVQAHIPAELKRDFDTKLVADDKTMQDVLTESVVSYVRGQDKLSLMEKDLIERLQEIRLLTWDMMNGRTEKDLLKISLALDDLISNVVKYKIK